MRHSPPRRGGEDAASIESREATEAPQTGWSDWLKHVAELTTPSAPSLRSAQPPLLCEEGNVFPKAIVFDDNRRYKREGTMIAQSHFPGHGGRSCFFDGIDAIVVLFEAR